MSTYLHKVSRLIKLHVSSVNVPEKHAHVQLYLLIEPRVFQYWRYEILLSYPIANEFSVSIVTICCSKNLF